MSRIVPYDMVGNTYSDLRMQLWMDQCKLSAWPLPPQFRDGLRSKRGCTLRGLCQRRTKSLTGSAGDVLKSVPCLYTAKLRHFRMSKCFDGYILLDISGLETRWINSQAL